MSEQTMLQKFVVGILQHPAGSDRIRAMMELDRRVRGNDALLRSGPPVELTITERVALNNPDSTMCVVAADLASQRYIGHVSGHLVVTRSRGARLEIEDVLTAEDFEGRGVGKATMATVLQESRRRWGVRRAVLTSRTSRVAARGLYAAFGFEQQGESHFVLKFGEEPWEIPAAARPRLWSVVDREADDGAFWLMTTLLRHSVLQICAGSIEQHAPWNNILPLGVYEYKDAP